MQKPVQGPSEHTHTGVNLQLGWKGNIPVTACKMYRDFAVFKLNAVSALEKKGL